ncbi:MAG: tetratricopeptide repeat protein [Nitrospinae bacterium]|nr:tetratricopeptide repeat protein [Nitrospinota bacterium]
MKVSKYILLSIAAVTGVLSFNLGRRYAQETPPALEKVEFSAQDNGTRAKLFIKGDIRFIPHMDVKMKELILSASGVDAFPGVYTVKHSDTLTESVRITRDSKRGELWITVSFKTPDIAFQRSVEDDGKVLIFDFFPKEKSLKIAGLTSEKLLSKLQAGGGAVETAAGKTPGSGKPTVAAEDESVTEAKKSLKETDKSYASMEMESGRQDFHDIMTLMQKGHMEEAAALSEAYAYNYPKSIYLEKVYFARADALYQLAKKDKLRVNEALEAYKTTLARYPNSTMTQQGIMRRAALYEDLDFDLEAMVEYNMAQKAQPSGKYSIGAMIGRAKIYLRQRKFQKAHDEMQKVLALYPNRKEVREIKYIIAEASHDQGKYEEARRIFEEAQKIWPTYPKTRPIIYMKMAENYYKLGEKEKALEYWTNIANMFPSVGSGRKAMLRIGEYSEEKNRKKDAARMFETLAMQYPDSDEAVLARLRLATMGAEDPGLLKTSRIFDYHAFENPLQTFDEILAKYPERHGEEALIRKGRALAGAKRHIASILAYKELLKSYPGSRMSAEVFGLVRGNLFKLIEAFHEQEGFFIALLTYFDNFNPFLRTITEPDILIKIADSFAVMTLYDRAQEYYAMAIKHDKEGKYSDLTDFRIAKAKLFGGEYKEAETLLSKYIKARPGQPSAIMARHFLGHALQAQGKNAEAASEWRIAIENDMSNSLVPNTAYNLGKLYKAEKKYGLAADAFNMTISTWKPPVKGAEEPDYFRDAKYHLAETYYLNEDYASAIREAGMFTERYKDDQRNAWLQYIEASSLGGASEDEKAAARLKELVAKDKGVIGKVASAKLQNAEWKNKNPALFPN